MPKFKKIDEEMIENKLVAQIIGMGWKASIEFGDMWLFEKEINGHKVEMRVTVCANRINGIDGFIESIWQNYFDFDTLIDIKGNDVNSVKDIIKKEIKVVYDECKKIL